MANSVVGRNGAVVDEAAIAAFGDKLHGVLLRPDSEGYDKARRVWSVNGNYASSSRATALTTSDTRRAVLRSG